MKKSHTVIIAVHCAPEGTDLDSILARLEETPGVTKAEDIKTIVHLRFPTTYALSVNLPAGRTER